MENNEYAKRLEKKLIDQFKKNFFEKFNYQPLVITQTENTLPWMPIEKLKDLCVPYEPGMCGVSRKREAVDMRAIFCYLAKSMKYTLKKIGEQIGARDHTTVRYNVIIFYKMMETSEGFQSKFLQILEELKEKANEK